MFVVKSGEFVVSVPLMVILVVAGVAGFIGIWCAVVWLISRIGGWAELARVFPAEELPPGEILWGQSAQLRGFCNYNGVLTIVVSEKGLYMQPWRPFRIGHAPLLVPWKELRNPRPREMLWVEQVMLDVGEPKIVKMCVGKRLFGKFPVI